PPPHPVGRIECVRRPPDNEAAEARDLDPLVHFLAHDRVDREVHLAGADPFVLGLGGRRAYHPPARPPPPPPAPPPTARSGSPGRRPTGRPAGCPTSPAARTAPR